MWLQIRPQLLWKTLIKAKWVVEWWTFGNKPHFQLHVGPNGLAGVCAKTTQVVYHERSKEVKRIGWSECVVARLSRPNCRHLYENNWINQVAKGLTHQQILVPSDLDQATWEKTINISCLPALNKKAKRAVECNQRKAFASSGNGWAVERAEDIERNFLVCRYLVLLSTNRLLRR